MPIVVQKYGGATVADLQKIRAVAQMVAKTKALGKDIVVVVSAMAGETDRLDKLASEAMKGPSLREYDLLLASGEQVSSALLALALQSMGFKAVSLLGHQVPIITSSSHANALVESVDSAKISQLLKEGNIVVVAGFQGVDQDGNITTLGRGGSDISAVAIASALKAESCHIYKEVDGVFTADPSIVPEAKRIPRISYDEMLELSSMGAKVVHTRAVQMARKYEIPLEVKQAFENGDGTIIGGRTIKPEGNKVVAVTCDKSEAKVSIGKIPNKPEVAYGIFKTLAENKISVDMIVQSIHRNRITDITFTVPKTDRIRTVDLLKEALSGIKNLEIFSNPSVAKVSVIGDAMKVHYGIAASIFGTLAKERIRILTITTSDTKVSCAIDEKYAELAVRALHEEFKLSNEISGKKGR